MGYPRVPMASLWPNGGNKTNWGNIQAKKIFFQKNTLCHSFRIIVILSVLLSFLPDWCHPFHIIVIPSVLVSFLLNIVIPCKLFRELQILISSKSFPYPKGEKNGHRRWPYLRVVIKRIATNQSNYFIFFSIGERSWKLRHNYLKHFLEPTMQCFAI